MTKTGKLPSSPVRRPIIFHRKISSPFGPRDWTGVQLPPVEKREVERVEPLSNQGRPFSHPACGQKSTDLLLMLRFPANRRWVC